MASRKIEDCIPELQEKFRLFAAKMSEAGIPFMLTCTVRLQEEQDALYAQGRTKPGQIVTWTKKSKHIERKAFDIAIIRNRRATWDIKVNVNENEIPDYIEAGQIGESVGLTWGGRFKNGKGQLRPDYPHFEI